MLTYILLVLGFVILLKGADLLVDGASFIARRMNVPSLMIGLTVVAFGTSAPELFISVYASLEGNTEIAISNVLGSNLANILLILGLAAIIFPLTFHRNTTLKEIPFSLLAALVMGLMANDVLINRGPVSIISRIDGLVLLCFFALFLYYIGSMARTGSNSTSGDAKSMTLLRAVLYVIIGMAGLVLGGHWIVDGAVSIARQFEVSQSLIGLTIVALGTSLPELATTITAAKKKDVDIAIGNVIGSNIFNIFLILGISASVKPLPFLPSSLLDMMMTIFSSLLLFLFVYFGKRHVLQRWQGILFVVLYFGYILFKIIWE